MNEQKASEAKRSKRSEALGKGAEIFQWRLFALKGRVPPADLAQKPMAKFAQLEPGLKHAGIAEYGIQTDELPPPWTKHLDCGTGCVYFVDSETQVATWESPLIPCLQRVLGLGRRYLESPSEDFFEDAKLQLWGRLKAELNFWHGPLESPEGRPYFANSHTGRSSWRDPRVDAQLRFDLEGGLLDSLAEALPPPEELEVPCFGSKELRAAYYRHLATRADRMGLAFHVAASFCASCCPGKKAQRKKGAKKRTDARPIAATGAVGCFADTSGCAC
eukprot:s521_g25.t1